MKQCSECGCRGNFEQCPNKCGTGSSINPDEAIAELTELNGEQYATIVAMEELSELTKELAKNYRGFDNRKEIVEELSDVELILVQVRQIFDIAHEETDPIKRQKLEKALRVSRELREKEA